MSKVLSLALKRDELNRNLGGGLPSNSLILMEGKEGTGKSILAQRFAYSLIQNDTKVTYISSELNTAEFVQQMASLDYDIKHHMLNEKIMFIPMFPFLGRVKLEPNFIDKLMNAERLFKNEVIIIDTFSSLLVQDNISEKKAFELIKFFKQITSLGHTIIFCVDSDHLNESLLSMLRATVDAYFKIEIKTFAGELVRVIFIQRFKRPKDIYITSIPFKVEPGKGLAIEIASFT
ncbi:ATPase [Candidatus Woesearchaeota archaeon CG11_big_fil_rev_8_21_14_0_20_43_8]|nr:MAG: ATPase [Candidatus Woesearchaeota archaeon CG11_big_fil_rev_8_21_14_0_20_43_8]PIO04545.1 MAG: ATPase [Candidatus Woesearchaeota archaeon CG08_land_8_20_14_0_20_43_7]